MMAPVEMKTNVASNNIYKVIESCSWSVNDGDTCYRYTSDKTTSVINPFDKEIKMNLDSNSDNNYDEED